MKAAFPRSSSIIIFVDLPISVWLSPDNSLTQFELSLTQTCPFLTQICPFLTLTSGRRFLTTQRSLMTQAYPFLSHV